MRGADPMESGLGRAAAAPVRGDVKIGQVPEFVYSEWQAQGAQVRHSRSPHEEKARATAERPPTDADDWDLPPHELFKLAAKFPGAVKSVQT